jgi:hypothetical protein
VPKQLSKYPDCGQAVRLLCALALPIIRTKEKKGKSIFINIMVIERRRGGKV